MYAFSLAPLAERVCSLNLVRYSKVNFADAATNSFQSTADEAEEKKPKVCIRGSGGFKDNRSWQKIPLQRTEETRSSAETLGATSPLAWF